MNGSQDPAVQRRRLRVALREARQQKGLTQKEVAQALEWSTSKLLRVEGTQSSVSTTDLKALLTQYGITEPERVSELVRMAQVARRQTWQNYQGVVSGEFAAYLGYESAASHIRQFETLLIPGLLQTEDYARAVIRALSQPRVGDELIERRVQARLDRQDLLTREDPPQMSFILDEAAVRRQVGKSAVMAQQLQHLKELAAHPKISIQVVPFSFGEYSAMKGPFVILEFPDPNDDPLLYLENSRGDYIGRDDPSDIEPYMEVFLALEDQATPKGWLNDTLDKILRTPDGDYSAPGSISGTNSRHTS